MAMHPHLILFDAMNLLRRYFAVHQAQPDAAQLAGQQALRLMLTILKQQYGTHTAAVFDGDGQNWRKYRYPPYKDNREPMPEALAQALDNIQQQWWQQGIDSILPERDEADDVIATLASKAAQHNVAVTIVSSDRGYAPLLAQGIQHWHPFERKMLDDAYYQQRYDIHAGDWPTFRALLGDASSNLPGVPGFGRKTAASYINQGQHADTLPEAKRHALAQHQQQFELIRSLVTLRTDCPLGFNLSELRW